MPGEPRDNMKAESVLENPEFGSFFSASFKLRGLT